MIDLNNKSVSTMEMSHLCSSMVTDLKSSSACLLSQMFLFCAADGISSLSSSSSWLIVGKSLSKCANISGAPVHQVRFCLTGHKDVIKHNLPDCFSVANLDMSLLTSFDLNERNCCRYASTAKLKRWLQQPNKGTPSMSAVALFVWQLSPIRQNMREVDKEYHSNDALMKLAWFTAEKLVWSNRGANANRWSSGSSDGSLPG